MKLPNGDRAIVTHEKLYGFLLNERHHSQPGHAILFRRLLGLTPANGEQLRKALLNAAARGEATPGQISPFGRKYVIRFPMTGPRGTYEVLSVWIIENGELLPRLVTAMID